MQLPDPTVTLTLPSIHDGTVLSCRVYHPLHDVASTTAAPRPRHAAVVAHPYAPMGGSYDDGIVGEVASQLLLRGLTVATFNFRGAGGSPGRTSWTARPERDDYATVVAFLVYYTHHIDAGRLPRDAPPPVLVLAGYSYGSMIASQLPPLEEILAPFASPPAESPAGHVRATAETLARHQRDVMMAASPSPAAGRGIRVGDGGGTRRKRSPGVRRSTSSSVGSEGVREFVRRHRPSPSGGGPPAPPQATLSQVPDLAAPRPAYVLVSPLVGAVAHLATMSRAATACEAQLRSHPTLAVYGDGDGFVSSARMRAWAGRMGGADGSRFRGHEVAGAGHFWVEHGALGRLVQLVDDFARELVGAADGGGGGGA